MAIPVQSNSSSDPNRKFYLIPFILITSLFFLWGLANILNSALIAHFQPVFNIGRTEAMLVETAFYFGYFTFALPAALFMERFRYKGGIILGLVLYAAGALLFIPAANQVSFPFFLAALYIIAAGLAFLETGANPYALLLGPEKSGNFRINLAQTFNGLALIVGPVIAAQMILTESDSVTASAQSVVLPYTIIGISVLVIALLFVLLKMPEPGNAQRIVFSKKIFSFSHLMKGVLAQFLYVGAQAGIWGITINYVVAVLPGTTSQQASGIYLFAGTILFVLGRITGTFLLSKLNAKTILTIFGVAAAAQCLGAAFIPGLGGVVCLVGVNFFMSIMFPTIFALAVADLGEHTKIGSALVVMAIVGGAILPPLMAQIAEIYSIEKSILLPVLSFLVVAWYGYAGSNRRQ